MNELSVLSSFMREELGFDVERLGASAVSAIAYERMLECGDNSLSDYIRRLKTDSDELNRLLERILVQETWFFRHWDTFETLKPHLLTAYQQYTQRQGQLHILSLACSTGEEPYSIAILMHNLGIDLKKVQIDAIDISARALRLARQGLYQDSSFRGDRHLLAYRERYFSNEANSYRLEPEISQHVRFSEGDALDERLYQKLPDYDIIFCRNLLIYLTPDWQQRLLRQLQSHLRPDGLLAVSPSESIILSSLSMLKQAKPGIPLFTYSADAVEEKYSNGQSFSLDDVRFNPVFNSHVEVSANVTFESNPGACPETIKAIQDGDVVEATLNGLINQGDIDTARTFCQSMLRSGQNLALAFYYLGVMEMKQQNYEVAEKYFSQHIYYAPDSLDGLRYRELALVEAGYLEAAALCSMRADRLQMRLMQSVKTI